jgi:glycosyltransferase involved in cell wall biosynthesis
MKILWVKGDFLHPTTKGGQIRTLEMLREMNKRHEVHYIGLDDKSSPEGPQRSSEYSHRSYAVEHRLADQRSLAFVGDLCQGLVSALPVAVQRFCSPTMKKLIDELRERERFDHVVCDFLIPAPNLSRLEDCVLFQHNVETMIWRRRAEQAPDPARKWYLAREARKMEDFERKVCNQVRHVIAVSEQDAVMFRQMFGVKNVSSVPTGVDIEFFRPPAEHSGLEGADLVFVGSMDWTPNCDGMHYFVNEILPRIRASKPDCSLVIVGRSPGPDIQAFAERDPRIKVTGTVKDVRPYLWGSKVSIVPLRIGGGTRLKIYESMAACVPVVSTSIGAEGLEVEHGRNIFLADDPESFAARCVELLYSDEGRRRMAGQAHQLVCSRFSWTQVSKYFESILEQSRLEQSRGA